ncbi:MAG: RrF2 family transcriptional regulator, partial [Planctomycetota bacterium]
MRISRKCQYALRAIFELGLRDPGQPVKIHEIADVQNIPPRFLEVILNQLRHGGFVESQRGSEGGYMLVQPAENLTVGDILRYIQGPISIASKEENRGRKGEYFYGDYAFEKLWTNVKSAICQVFDNTTFAEL